MGSDLKKSLDEVIFKEGDEVILKGKLQGLMNLGEDSGVSLKAEEDLGLEGIRTESAVLMEGIIGPDSTMAGKSLKELNFRQQFGVLIVAVHRRGRNLQERFEDVKLAFGDTLLVQGSGRRMQQLFQLKDFINLSEPKQITVRPKKAPFAILAILAFMIIGMLGGVGLIPKVPIVLIALSAAFFRFGDSLFGALGGL